jgi:hypothetical protein
MMLLRVEMEKGVTPSACEDGNGKYIRLRGSCQGSAGTILLSLFLSLSPFARAISTTAIN